MQKPLTEGQIRQIVQSEINKNEFNSRFGVNSVPNHTHDGIDSLPIREDSVILTDKLTTNLVSVESESFTIRNVFNAGRVSFHGFARYPLSPDPASVKATISGEVIFGNCSYMIGTGTAVSIVPITIVTGNGNTAGFIQASNYILIDEGSIANTTVGSGPYLATASDTTEEVARLSLTSYVNDTLTFTVTLATNWELNGILTIE